MFSTQPLVSLTRKRGGPRRLPVVTSAAAEILTPVRRRLGVPAKTSLTASRIARRQGIRFYTALKKQGSWFTRSLAFFIFSLSEYPASAHIIKGCLPQRRIFRPNFAFRESAAPPLINRWRRPCPLFADNAIGRAAAGKPLPMGSGKKRRTAVGRPPGTVLLD